MSRENGCLGGEHELIPLSDLAGVEHRVRLDHASKRVYKCTHPESYGGGPQINFDLDPVTDRPQQRLVLGKATPMQYLVRWQLFNEVFGDEVRLERVLTVGYGLSIIVSQRDITGLTLAVDEITAYFHERGFVPAPSSQDAFYRASDDLLALDAHQGNLVLTPDGVVPIDIPIFHPDSDIAKWLRRSGL